MKNTQGWHVIYVNAKHEKKVHEELQRRNIDSFLPMISTVRQWSDRKKKIQTPLFPSYVFVNIQSQHDFHNALSVDGACAYIRFGSEYGKVSQKEIEEIKMLVGVEDVTNVEMNRELPAVGDKLKIAQGELSGLECEVYKVNNANKIKVRLNSLHQNISATIPAYYLRNSLHAS